MINKIIDHFKKLLIKLLKKLVSYLKRECIKFFMWLFNIFKVLFYRLMGFIKNKINNVVNKFKWYIDEYIFSKFRNIKLNLRHKRIMLRIMCVLIITIISASIYFIGPNMIKHFKSNNNSLSFVEYNTHIEEPTKSNSTTPTPINNQVSVDNSYGWPTEGNYYITTYFSGRHDGIDIAGCGYGSNIYAVFRGEVITSGYTYTNGNYIIIRDDNGVYSMYAHLSKRYVFAGQRVDKGTVIGAMGSTGNSTGPHLHFSTWNGYPYYGGVAFNPYTLY